MTNKNTTTELKSLLGRAAKQLTAWHKKYGENNPQWLPPAGDVRLLEDIDEVIAGRSAAHGEPSKAEQFCDGHCTWLDHHPECKAGSAEQVSDLLREALQIGLEAAQEVAEETHKKLAGYKPARHAAVDADVQKIERTIAAIQSAPERKALSDLDLPTLPQSLINLIGEYGMARTDGLNQLEVQHKWLSLIGGIKDYARALLAQASAQSTDAGSVK